MSFSKSLIILSAAAMLAAPAAFAQEAVNPAHPKAAPKGPTIEQRLENQKKRIETAEKNGTLTAKQAESLKQRETKMEQMVAAAKAKNNGELTPADKARLKKAETNLGNAVRQMVKNEKAAAANAQKTEQKSE